MRWESLLALFFCMAPPLAADSLEDVVRAFRERQATEQRAQQQEVDRLVEHLASLKAMRANLSLPREAEADRTLAKTAASEEQALTQARLKVAKAERIVAGEFVGVPDSVRGGARRESEAWQEPLTRATPVVAGDAVRTLPDGHATLLFEDGNRVTLAGDSLFRLIRRSASDTVYELAEGAAHVVDRPVAIRGVLGQTQYRTPTAVLDLLGTEFDLSLDGAGRTHLALEAGTVRVQALPMSREDLGGAWWLGRGKKPLDTAPLGFERWLRVLAMEGEVRLVRADGIPRRAVVGAELIEGERLETGANGFVIARLRGDCQVAMKAKSRLAGLRRKKGFFFQTDKGVFHVQLLKSPENPEPRPPFQTTDALARPQDGTFEFTADPTRTTEWVPLDGTAEIKALGYNQR